MYRDIRASAYIGCTWWSFGLDVSVTKGTLQIKTEVAILLKLCPHSLNDVPDVHQIQCDFRYVWSNFCFGPCIIEGTLFEDQSNRSSITLPPFNEGER